MFNDVATIQSKDTLLPEGVEVAKLVLESEEDWEDCFDTDSMADMDVDFDACPYPVLHHIWANQEGEGYGYVLFHCFLKQIGVGEVFVATPTLEAGQHLFDKLVEEGVIEAMSASNNPEYPHKYSIISDPFVNLMKYVERHVPNSFQAELQMEDDAQWSVFEL